MKMASYMQSGDFDPNASSRLERLIFNHRMVVVLASLVVTVLLALSAFHLRLNADFESVIPAHQPMIVNYLENKQNLEGFGNSVDIIVEADHGTVMNKRYMMALQHINDEVFLIPGVNRSYMRSLWTSNVRWSAVTDAGLAGGPVMPMDFDGSAASLASLQQNIERSGEIGTLVAPDFKSAMIEVPLLERDYVSGKPINYGTLADRFDKIRSEYAKQGVSVRVVGFAMVEGDIIRALRSILGFFLISVVITVAMVYWYTRCARSTSIVVACSLVAVVWLLGLLPLLKFELDPYSILVPFLVFAIGISHGSQKMNGVIQDIGRGNSRLVAARLTFRRLFLAGLTAIVCDAVGFAVLLMVDIKAIQVLAITASLGVVILVFTNLIFLPVLLSYVGVSASAAERSFREENRANAGLDKHPVWAFLDRFTRRGWAAVAVFVAFGLGGLGMWGARHVQIGDLDSGAPELRVHSQYNMDNAYFVGHYGASSDQFVVMVKTPSQQCAQFSTLATMDALESKLRQVPGVGSTVSVADFERNMAVQLNEGNFDWYDLVPNQASLNQVLFYAPATMVSSNCDFMTIVVSLKDHKAQTLSRVVATVESFLNNNQPENATMLMAAGNAGIEAATNIVVAHANHVMLLGVYAAVILLCFFNFRSWRAVLVAVLPLVLTSVLAEALMVALGIGVKVATLPVTALGVGIGVDYSLYILSVTLANMRAGMALSEAYYRALLFTGKVVILTGLTLAVGVATWVFSPIKYQADMGMLLAFMFIWNMLGAIVLLPALASFLLPRSIRSAQSERGSAELMRGIGVRGHG
jgi:predicted RND superfamily exporter protein